MFFKRKRDKNLKNRKMSFESVGLKEQKMPIVTLNHSWHQLITEIKTPQIETLEKELTNLLKEQGRLNTDYIEYTRMKKNMLDTILNLTHEAFELKSEDAIKKIEDQQKMILKINDNLEQIEEGLDTVPNRIQEVNGLLLDQSVQLSYHHMNQYRVKSEELDEEIQVIRNNLLEKTDEKKTCDQKAGQLYQYLHQLVGPGYIEKLDHQYWENSK